MGFGVGLKLEELLAADGTAGCLTLGVGARRGLTLRSKPGALLVCASTVSFFGGAPIGTGGLNGRRL